MVFDSGLLSDVVDGRPKSGIVCVVVIAVQLCVFGSSFDGVGFLLEKWMCCISACVVVWMRLHVLITSWCVALHPLKSLVEHANPTAMWVVVMLQL